MKKYSEEEEELNHIMESLDPPRRHWRILIEAINRSTEDWSWEEEIKKRQTNSGT